MRHLFTKLLLVLGTIGFFMQEAQATHFMGVDINYECIGACTYRVYHKSYYDCTGAATPNPPSVPPAPNITFSGTPIGCNTVPLPASAWTIVHYIEITPICPSFKTACDSAGSPINGVREAIYRRDYDFCSGGSVPCTAFTMGWGSCCRNGAITSGAANSGIYTGNTRIDLSITPCNSSPTFLAPPVPYICAGQPFTFNQGAFDPDGDSLAYVLGPCVANAPNTSVGYSPGYSAQQPLGPDWDVQMNPFTGDITITPNPGGGQVVGVMCIVVQEWRNGVQIGSVVRDMQITVITGCTSTNPVTGGIQNLTIGGVPANPLSPTEALTCSGTNLCFEIPVIPADTALDYTISWNQSITGASFVDARGSGQTNSISGPGSMAPIARFCWTPPQDGVYSFVVTTTDNACPIQGLNQYTILIYVDNVLKQSSATAIPIMNCNEVVLTALPKTLISSPYNHIYTYQWSGNGNLQPGVTTAVLTDSVTTHKYPKPDNYFYDLTLRDTFGCQHSFRSFFTLNSGVIADAGPDLTICSGYQFQMGSPNVPGQYYQWTPATGLSDSSVADPTFSLLNLNQGQVDTINFSVYVTDSVCNTTDFVTVVINPSLQVRISPFQPTICRGDSITLTASGGTSYLWSTGDTTNSIRVGPNSNTTYSAVTFSNGCTSLPEYTTVAIDPGPPGNISGTFRVCPGDATLLVADGGTSQTWYNGVTSPTLVINNVQRDTTVYMIPFENGCPGDTVYATVGTYDAPLPDFTVNTVCQGLETVFFDASSVASGSIVGWSWDFGDPASGGSNNSNLEDPIHIFSNSGNYTVTLTVTTDNGCENTINRVITVEPVPVADFNATNVCQGFANAFTDNSTIAVGGTISSYAWSFGDGNSGIGNALSHQYDTSGFYNVTLIVTSSGGCIDSLTKTVFVHPNPVADFDVIDACQDSVVFTFNGSSVGGGLDEVTGYAWNFGDPASGGDNTSNLKTPTHTYTTPGMKNITLTVVTGNGCVNTVNRSVTVYEEPRPDFIIDGNCLTEVIVFTDDTDIDPSTPIVDWVWDYGNGKNAEGKPKVSLSYQTDGPGTYPVTMTVTSSEGCTKSVTKDVLIDPVPYANFVAPRVCPGDSMFFFDRSEIPFTMIVDWSWDFGGPGSGVNGVPNARFLYNGPGYYDVTLTAISDKGCEGSYTRTVQVHDYAPTPEIQDDIVCFSDPAFLLAGAPANTEVNWYENINSPEPFHTGFSYVTPPLAYSTTYYVEVTSEVGCIGERFPITGFVATDEQVNIIPSTTVLELPLGVVDFRTSSTIPLAGWMWDFGDGNVSDLSEPVHEYEFPGIYEVVLTATDTNGCVHTATTEIEVKKLAHAFMPSAFSPNGDGINDYYAIGAYNLREFQIRIFNRWGQTVFEATQPDFQWFGKLPKGGDAQEGVYVYHVRYLDIDGKRVETSGTITLIR